MQPPPFSRRSWLAASSSFLGTATLATLESHASVAPQLAHAPTAKHVIYLFMSGGPSHVDTFDYKPQLERQHGQPIPESYVKDVHFAMIPSATKRPKLHASPFRFTQHGESGQWVSDLLPKLAQQVDKLAIIKSLHSRVFNHDPAVNLLNTGDSRVGRPTMGAWLSYGLGNLTENFPAYVVLTSGVKRQPLLSSYWSNGFLPSQHQGVELRNAGDPILFLSNPTDISREQRRQQLDLLRATNELRHEETHDPEIRTRIRQYELAFRMQAESEELLDVTRESKSTLAKYGVEAGKPSFAKNCLLARRMVEKGIRFVQLYDMGWDSHDSLQTQHVRQCRAVDQSIAALLQDLEDRGLLEETLVIWGGEFGRTPVIQGGGKKWGRDHHPHGFTMWLAGGGIRPGIAYGATDEFGFHAAVDPLEVHDLHATVLHTLGIDHRQMTYRHQGRDFRLTDVGGRVIQPLLKNTRPRHNKG